MSVDNASSISDVWRSPLDLVGLHHQCYLEARSASPHRVELFLEKLDHYSCLGRIRSRCGTSFFCLGSLDFTSSRMANACNPAPNMDEPAQHQSLRHRAAPLTGSPSGIIGVIQSQVRAQREAIKSLELQRQLAAAHLRALQMQMEPPFLFNTLNAITTLVEHGRQVEALLKRWLDLNALLKTTLSPRNAGEDPPRPRVRVH